MIENIDLSLIEWSRAQFAVTAMYHWIFVPLTLGISFIIAIMESLYVRTGDPEWKRITRFWMTLFGINFAIGVATGIILEFEFGTNWSNYSWFVGDIFGAPLAIEGIMAFFLESTFIAIMFFGWNKVSKKFHLLSTWLTAIGANLSALWILVANAWMQHPVGMKFNPDTARNEMLNFWEVLFSPTAINKFLHTTGSSYVLSAVFVVGVSSWFLLKKREVRFAKKSIIVASVFGLVFSLFTAITGDGSARRVALDQPMKLAAMENLKEGRTNAPLVAVGALRPGVNKDTKFQDFIFKIEIPNMLSFLAYHSTNSFVPGIKDLLYGNPEYGIISYDEKIAKGKKAINALADYKKAKENRDDTLCAVSLKHFEENYCCLGYGYFDNAGELIPRVPELFYSFRIMVMLSVHFMILMIVFLILTLKNKLENKKWILYVAIISIPMAYLASQLGWIIAELGRQPWVIQDIMPVMVAVTSNSSGSVQTTFWLFIAIFTALLTAELKIMFRQIKIGPKDGGK
jgi:cytochrome d ubiquinol oxidase subunit I